MPIEYIWMLEEDVPGVLISLGAFYSLVRYSKGGFEYEVLVENTDFVFYENEDFDDDHDDE